MDNPFPKYDGARAVTATEANLVWKKYSQKIDIRDIFIPVQNEMNEVISKRVDNINMSMNRMWITTEEIDKSEWLYDEK